MSDRLSSICPCCKPVSKPARLTSTRHSRNRADLRNTALVRQTTSGSAAKLLRSQRHYRRFLGVGFDRVSQCLCALAVEDYFDIVSDIDIIDINAGSHGKYSPPTLSGDQLPRIYAPSGPGQNSQWVSEQLLFEVKRTGIDLPVVGAPDQAYMDLAI